MPQKLAAENIKISANWRLHRECLSTPGIESPRILVIYETVRI